VASGVVMAACAACGSTNETTRDKGAGLPDRPPPSELDPFADTTLPANAVQAPASGVVVEEREPPGGRIPVPPPEASGPAYQCYSCVKICPNSDPTSDCRRSKEDLICGWGAGEERDAAVKLARAECDAALDMVRETPRFSRIEGSCPPAVCR